MLEFRMHSDELLRAGLRRLLHATPEKPAGEPARRREVARAAGVSADNLYQIAMARPLDSGLPRSVGRTVREKIEEAFPDWLEGLSEESVEQPPNVGHAVASVRDALRIISDRLLRGTSAQRERAADALMLLAKAPDSPLIFEDAADVISSLGKSQ